MKFISKSKTLLASLAFVALSGGAQAATVNLSIDSYMANGVPYTAIVNAPSNVYEGDAGVLAVTPEGALSRFLAFCIEFNQRIDKRVAHEYESEVYKASNDVQELYDRFYGNVLQSQTRAVGFQLALWELLGQINVDQFNSPPAAIADAKQLLSAVRTGPNDNYQANAYEFKSWTNGQYQNVLEALAATNDVPEPASQALVLGALALLALSLRARRRQSGDKSL